jgi:hypothetical protein
VWSSLGLAALAGSQVAQADEIAPGPAAAPAYMQLADNAGEQGEGGEGEGGGASSEMDDAAILKAMAAAKSDAATMLKTVVSLLREAGEEFEIGVKQGKIVNLHEYQDAYGFTMIARDMTEAAKAQAKPEQAAVFDTVLGEIDKLKGEWPDIRGEKPVTAEAKTILVAASKAELAS